MGNICSGGKEESKKGAFVEERRDNDGSSEEQDRNFLQQAGGGGVAGGGLTSNAAAYATGTEGLVPHHDVLGTDAGAAGQDGDGLMTAAEQRAAEQAAARLKEQARAAKMIVQETGRAMVSVRSTRGSTVYYDDQGFAAALSQHLEQTTRFPDRVPARLPPAPQQRRSSSSSARTAAAPPKTGGSDAVSNNNTVYAILSQPEWEGISLGGKNDGLAGCAGEHPAKYMDHICEQFLDSLLPKKERLFAKAPPIMENLL